MDWEDQRDELLQRLNAEHNRRWILKWQASRSEEDRRRIFDPVANIRAAVDDLRLRIGRQWR